jgi:tetratricopeptide (TPR) repeat protein
MAALANRYLKLKRFDDAERCAKQKIRVAPDYPAYETLAAIYKEKGDMPLWKETLEKSLDLPSMGLKDATIRDRIAQYHMGRKEWKEAVVYADAAAESYSAWSMLTAARCHEMLGEWAKSEALMRAISERYDDSAMGWMLWCHRTGHGDAAAADKCARTHFESLGTSFYSTDRQKIGIYYLLRNEPEKALVVFQQTFGETHGVYDAMHAAMLADALGKEADRDSLLSKIVAGNPAEIKQEPRAGLYKQLVEFLRKALPPGSVKGLDFKKLDTLILVPPDLEVPANLEYFVAMFLKNRGAADKSHEYLIRCSKTLFDNKYNCIVARKTLRELKIPIPDPPTATQAAVKK